MESHELYRYYDQMGNLGIERTFDNVIKSYWFPKSKKLKSIFLSKMQFHSHLQWEKRRDLNYIPKGQVPFEMSHIDHYRPIDRERLVKQYRLVVIDSFTKFVKLYSTKTTAVQEAINHLTTHLIIIVDLI